MRFASQMHKSLFLGRKVQAQLTRKSKPKTDDWDGVADVSKTNSAIDEMVEKAKKAGTFTLFPSEKAPPPVPPGFTDDPMADDKAFEAAFADDIAMADGEDKPKEEEKPKAQLFRLKQGTRVRLKGIESKP